MDDPITLEFDGGARGNPGPAGIGVVLRAKDGTELVTLGRFIGRATNNVAEYRALITALEQAKALGAKKVAIRGDSELVVKQMRGEYRVKNEALRELYDQAQALLRQFDHATIDHNYRNKNALADKLANLAMDRKAEVTEVDGGGGGGGGDAGLLDAPSPVAPKEGDRHACGRCGSVIAVQQPTSVRPHQLKPFVCQCGNKMERAES
jgi:ribonuclease HI